ncbi:MAG: ferrous iron transport protein B [Verrucomicrobiota bacterium]
MKELEIPHIAVAGNPNTGKSSIFNALTGLRQKVSNYPGVTVEKHEGVLQSGEDGEVHVIDLPGTYSLNPRSLDEQLAHDVLLGLRADTPIPALIVAIADASNLERNLFLVSQLLSLGRPMVVALNMMDVCRASGAEIDVAKLSARLGVPVIPMVASRREGVKELKRAILEQIKNPRASEDPVPLSPAVAREIDRLAEQVASCSSVTGEVARGEALRLLCTEDSLDAPRWAGPSGKLRPAVEEARLRLQQAGLTWYGIEAEARYRWIEQVVAEVRTAGRARPGLTDRADRWLTHPVAGPAVLAFVILAIFVSIFKLARPPMDWIKHLFGYLAQGVVAAVPPGPVQSLLTDGIIAGVGGVVAFLPQIMLLFFFIAILEDSGYTARVAFLLDRIMGRVGLHGKAFIPLFSSFACAIPGIMAARTIDNARDRLLTILIAPLMCCAARWPVYLLVAGTVIPNVSVLGFAPLPALVLGGMVILGVVAALVAAAVLSKTVLKGQTSNLALELPPYRRPRLRVLLHLMWERSLLFLNKAGTVILAMSVIMWALASYPRRPAAAPEEQVQHSFAGGIGRFIEPALKPIGFDWKIGVAILSSFVAREVFVSSLATIYGANVTDPDRMADLQTHLRNVKDPLTGKPFFTPLRGICIMLFYVLSMQCVSTMVVVRREAGGWKWPILQWTYMTGLAWLCCFGVWQVGLLLGWS